MLVKGKTYVYQYNGQERRGVYLRSTPAWNIFQRDGGEDWLKSYAPYYESEEEKNTVEEIVRGIEKSVHVPDVVLFPAGYRRK